MEFLIEGIGQTSGIDEVVARGCVDTIAIVVTDHDVAPRLTEYLDYIVGEIIKLLDTVTFVNFYDFLNDFVKLFAQQLAGPRIISLVSHLVARISKEQAAKRDGSAADSSAIVLDKCMATLRICVDNGVYMPQLQAPFTEALKPIFEFLADPTQIAFEDDIVLLVKSIIKKTKAVSADMWIIFDQFPKIVTKASGALGDLLSTMNYYVLYDAPGFAAREASIRGFAQIVEQAMFTRKIAADCEGAVACQLLFQCLRGTSSLDALLEPLLDLTRRRMDDDPTPIELKRHLFGVIMAAMYYNAPATLGYLESRQLTASVIEEMCEVRTSFRAEYERRFFIIGLTCMLRCPQLPVSLQP